MPSNCPLILSEEPVTRGLLAKVTISKPNIAVVYADAFGQVAVLDEGRPLTWGEQLRYRYRTRYEVDLSDHRRTAQFDSFPLPAQGDMYFFHSAVDVGFRVTDPAAVVKRHVSDAIPVVYNYLIDAFRPITRRHEIRDAEGAEREINLTFQHPVTLEEGITIYRCLTRLALDTAAQDYLRTIETADRALHVGEAQHKVSRAATRNEHELAAMEQTARLTAESREYAAIANRQIDVQGLIRTHLSKHPDQTGYALELLAQHEQAQLARGDLNDQRSLDLVRYMIEQGLIQAMDIEILRKQTLGRVQEIASPSRPAALPAAAWDDELPGDSVPLLSLAPESTLTEPIPDTAVRQAARNAVPIYLVADESPADQEYIDALNSGIRDLLYNVSKHPDVMETLRLSVIGFAANYDVRLPLGPVTEKSHVRLFMPGSGRRLGPISAYLCRQIDDDIKKRKADGLKVVRPKVYLLGAGSPEDSPAWESAYQRLPDRTVHAFAPDIFVLGAGDIDAETMQSLAAQPGTYGWVASPGLPLADAAARYFEFACASTIALARSFLSGSSAMSLGNPEDFQPLGSHG